MSDKTGPPTTTDWWRECERLRAELAQERNERDATADMLRELRAEYERMNAYAAQDREGIQAASIEIDRLRAALEDTEKHRLDWAQPLRDRYDAVQTVNERLRDTVAAIADDPDASAYTLRLARAALASYQN